MSVLEILKIPHPLLRRRAKRARRVDKRLIALAHDMVDTMRAAGGVGLAANQVGELRRLIVIQLPDEDEARIYINPEISRRKGEREVDEGCLSHPGYRARVNRSLTVRFGALDHAETEVRIDAEGLLAQAMEHEVDHLDGILYLDHLAEHAKPYRVDDEGRRIDADGNLIDADGNPIEESPSCDSQREEREVSYESRPQSAPALAEHGVSRPIATQSAENADRETPSSMALCGRDARAPRPDSDRETPSSMVVR